MFCEMRLDRRRYNVYNVVTTRTGIRFLLGVNMEKIIERFVDDLQEAMANNNPVVIARSVNGKTFDICTTRIDFVSSRDGEIEVYDGRGSHIIKTNKIEYEEFENCYTTEADGISTTVFLYG